MNTPSTVADTLDAAEILDALIELSGAVERRNIWGRDNVPAMRDEQKARSAARKVIAKARGEVQP